MNARHVSNQGRRPLRGPRNEWVRGDDPANPVPYAGRVQAFTCWVSPNLVVERTLVAPGCGGGSVIFCEAVAIYGVVVAILLATKTEVVGLLENGDYESSAKTAGYAIFASGLTVGMANLVCG